MKFVLHPWQLLLLILAGWINRQDQDVIEYLKAENRVLRERLCSQLLIPGNEANRISGEVTSRERLGGQLQYYYRKAA